MSAPANRRAIDLYDQKAWLKKELDQVLRHAIEERHLLRFRYKGKRRIVEPHDCSIQKGISRLLCWQIGGLSGSPIPGWRLMNVAEMQDCECLTGNFPEVEKCQASIPDGTRPSFASRLPKTRIFPERADEVFQCISISESEQLKAKS
jgi:hypothetical protein